MTEFEKVVASLREESEVALLGDWHGDARWGQHMVAQAAKRGHRLLLHVGDFGVWPDNRGEKFLRRLDRTCKENDSYLFVTPGNHENWTRLEKHWAKDGGLPTRLQEFERLWFLPRGTRFAINDVSFLSFGGAASLDSEWRVKGQEWWSQELATQEDVDAAVAAGSTDVLILHETLQPPLAVPSVEEMLASNPMGFGTEALVYSAESRRRVTEVFEGTQPRVVAHGHMHCGEAMVIPDDRGRAVIIASLDRQEREANYATLNLEALKAAKAADTWSLDSVLRLG